MHLLRQHTIDIACSSQKTGKEIQAQLGYLLEKEFYPKLELLLDRYAVAEHTWNIGLLEFDLPEIPFKNWKSQLISQTLDQIEDHLKRHRPTINAKHKQVVAAFDCKPSAQHAASLFFDFLQTGELAENSIAPKLGELLAAILIDSVFLKQLIAHLAHDKVGLIRWIFAVPKAFREKVAAAVDSFPNELRSVLSVSLKIQKLTIGKLGAIARNQWIELLQWFVVLHRESVSRQKCCECTAVISDQYFEVGHNELRAVLAHVILQIETAAVVISHEIKLALRELEIATITTTEVATTTQLLEKPANFLADGCFINNAGLVILHPFLSSLFEQLGLCTNDQWTTKTAQHSAILLTQYLVTGNDEIYENELTLNKILCGLPQNALVNTGLKINKKQKQKCQTLLESVKQYWKPMSTSSVEALRETFLIRDGKITQPQSGIFEMQVVEKGYDLLLDDLPWGIGFFKTPWMQAYMNCYWI